MSLTDFLQPVQEGLAVYMEMEDADGAVQSDDPVLVEACKLAFNQVASFVRRPLLRKNNDEVYIDIDEAIYLRNVPLAETPNITVIDFDSGETLAEGEQWVLVGGQDYATHIRFMYDMTPKMFRVQYTGGMEKAEGVFLEALIAQGAAMYRRRDLLGTGRTEGPQDSFRIVSDAGGLIKTVVQMLEPWVYYDTVTDYLG